MDAQTLVFYLVVLFLLILEQSVTLSLSHCRTTLPLFAPHVVVPFYFYESRKNPEAACALNSLKYGYMLNDLESQKYEAARCHSVKEKVVLL